MKKAEEYAEINSTMVTEIRQYIKDHIDAHPVSSVGMIVQCSVRYDRSRVENLRDDERPDHVTFERDSTGRYIARYNRVGFNYDIDGDNDVRSLISMLEIIQKGKKV